MKPSVPNRVAAGLLMLVAGWSGCTKERAPNPADARAGLAEAPSAKHAHEHEHHAPHRGTVVVLGEELYHLELVVDGTEGTLQAYALDGEMENFVRLAMPSFEIVAAADGVERTLTMSAVANSATGETVGDTALFEVKAGWLKTKPVFDGVIPTLKIRGTTFTGVTFNFPHGNEAK